jgi:hypothetical protein
VSDLAPPPKKKKQKKNKKQKKPKGTRKRRKGKKEKKRESAIAIESPLLLKFVCSTLQALHHFIIKSLSHSPLFLSFQHPLSPSLPLLAHLRFAASSSIPLSKYERKGNNRKGKERSGVEFLILSEETFRSCRVDLIVLAGRQGSIRAYNFTAKPKKESLDETQVRTPHNWIACCIAFIIHLRVLN